MLTILIYIADLVRRAMRKLVRAVFIVTESYREAQQIRRTMGYRSMAE